MSLGPCGKGVQSASAARPSLGWPNKWPQVDVVRDLCIKTIFVGMEAQEDVFQLKVEVDKLKDWICGLVQRSPSPVIYDLRTKAARALFPTLSDQEKKVGVASKDYRGEGRNGTVWASIEEENIYTGYSLPTPISFMGEMIFASSPFNGGGNELVVMGEDAELLVELLRVV